MEQKCRAELQRLDSWDSPWNQLQPPFEMWDFGWMHGYLYTWKNSIFPYTFGVWSWQEDNLSHPNIRWAYLLPIRGFLTWWWSKTKSQQGNSWKGHTVPPDAKLKWSLQHASMSETLLKGCHRGIVGNQVPYIATGWTSLFKFQLSEGFDIWLSPEINHLKNPNMQILNTTLWFGHGVYTILWSSLVMGSKPAKDGGL